MVIDNIRNSTKHLYERFSSPFGGTFITVWAIHHWQLGYSFFTFDDDCTLNDRIYILQQYINKSDSLNLFWYPLVNTFIVMSSYLLLSNLGYAVVLIFEKWAKPFIHYFIDKNKNASTEELIRLKSLLQDAYINFDKAKDEAQLAKSVRDTIEQKYTESMIKTSNLRSIQLERATKIQEQEKIIEDLQGNIKIALDKIGDLELLIDELDEVSNSKVIDNVKEIFDGAWTVYFTQDFEQTHKESFLIENKNWYVTFEQKKFKITNFQSFDDGQYIVFTKEEEGEYPDKVRNKLLRINEKHYVGVQHFESTDAQIDGLNFQVEYVRMDAMTKQL